MTDEQEEELKEKYYELQMIQEHLKQLQQQAEALDEQYNELGGAFRAIEDIEKSKPGEEILLPISSGIFLKASIKDSKDLLVNVGTNVLVKKDTEKTKEILKDRIKTVTEYRKETALNSESLGARAKTLDKQLKKLVAEMK
ncbi:MAG: prefoldin subunit alpha [Candidatus Woesearchaeota archaeon]